MGFFSKLFKGPEIDLEQSAANAARMRGLFDAVVPEGGKDLVALTMITGHIRHYLDEGQDEI